MRVIVLGGFLGSGKTTVLLQLARMIVEKYQASKKYPVAIIENEIGDVSVDSKLLGDYQIREIFSGCICCTLSADLTQSVIEIADLYEPEYVIIECTGLAYPDKVVSTIRKYAHECSSVLTITIADASRWYEIMDYMDVFLTGQMKAGDIMVLNKIDLVDNETMRSILSELRDLNAEAEVIGISASEDISALVEHILTQ